MIHTVIAHLNAITIGLKQKDVARLAEATEAAEKFMRTVTPKLHTGADGDDPFFRVSHPDNGQEYTCQLIDVCGSIPVYPTDQCVAGKPITLQLELGSSGDWEETCLVAVITEPLPAGSQSEFFVSSDFQYGWLSEVPESLVTQIARWL